MKISEILSESKSADLYHGTSIEAAQEILESNSLQVGYGSANEGNVSFTRSFGAAWEMYAGQNTIGVIFVFDQLKLSQKLGRKLRPFDWGGGTDEQEEASSVDIDNVSNYIKQIIVQHDTEITEDDVDQFALVFNDPRTVLANRKNHRLNFESTGRQFAMQLKQNQQR